MHLDGRERLPDAGKLNADVVRAPVLDQADLGGARGSQLAQGAALHHRKKRLQFVHIHCPCLACRFLRDPRDSNVEEYARWSNLTSLS